MLVREFYYVHNVRYDFEGSKDISVSEGVLINCCECGFNIDVNYYKNLVHSWD
jgi:hypothetical protein